MPAMALPHWLTRVNLAFTNRLTRPLAARLPWFAVVEHVGRRSGQLRQTPLNAFDRGSGRWTVALTYGPDVQWVRNVLAAGRCRMMVQGRWIELAEPRRYHDPARRHVPLVVRWALTVLHVEWFLELREAPGPGGGAL
jgi:deazaflavin-dependent oxidoreductase (nitroreductase family)